MRRWRRLPGAALVVLCCTLAFALIGAPVTAARSGSDLVAHELRVPLDGGARRVTLWLQPGFEVQVAASGLPHARMLAQSPSGDLVLTQHFAGTVTRLSDSDGDGAYDRVTPILTDLPMPHGVAFIGNILFVATNDAVLRLDAWADGGSARRIAALPEGGMHQTRTLAAGPDGALYVSIGSSCDACDEDDPRRAAIWRLDLDSGDSEPVARGLRNAVGLTVGPDGSTLWATENERNDLGDHEPPDEVNRIRPGGDYGWPACYGDRVPAPGLGSPARCSRTDAPTVPLPAHIAPLGLAFYSGTTFPEPYRGDLFVAFHGSALRDDPVGYEVARIVMLDGVPAEVQTFMAGWLVDGDSWGRPVAPFVAQDGSLLITDDKAGLIYRVRSSGGSTSENANANEE